MLSRRHIFLTAFDGGTLYTQCFDRETGRLVWERAEQPVRHEDAHVLQRAVGGHAGHRRRERLRVLPRPGVVSYDAAGAVRWKQPMGPFTNRMGAVASPIIAGPSLVLVLDQIRGVLNCRAVARDRRGAVESARQRDGCVDDAGALRAAGSSRRRLSRPAAANSAAHAVESGERLWTHKGMAPAMVASPVVTGDTVVGFGYGYDATPPSPRR